MPSDKRRKWLAAGLVALAIATYGYVRTTTHWETITTFAPGDARYRGGNFRVRGNEIMSLALALPEVTFKSLPEQQQPQRAEPTEAWMNDTGELLNRMTVSFFRGTVDDGMQRLFRQPGQHAAWWASTDWAVQFVGTSWIDYKSAEGQTGDAPQTTRLWKTVDGGRTWAQLPWPEQQDIDRLLFVDPQRGYAAGGGPRIWRTADGGATWQAIDVPAAARVAGQPRRHFDAINLGPDGVLRIAYHVGPTADAPTHGVVARLDWGRSAFVTDTVLPRQTVIHLDAAPGPAEPYALYALSHPDQPQNGEARDSRRRTGILSTWTNADPAAVRQLRTFDKKLALDGLAAGRDGVLLVFATDPNSASGGAPVGLLFSSTDAGKSWQQASGQAAQDGYFDAQTNTLYALSASALRKRTF
ncbi:WD40/YVTN/BNR-like repeat-containing protein [Burkholderia cenocepacia]